MLSGHKASAAAVFDVDSCTDSDGDHVCVHIYAVPFADKVCAKISAGTFKVRADLSKVGAVRKPVMKSASVLPYKYIFLNNLKYLFNFLIKKAQVSQP